MVIMMVMTMMTMMMMMMMMMMLLLMMMMMMVMMLLLMMYCRHCCHLLFVKLSHMLQGRRSLRRVQSGVETFYAPDILSCPAYRFRYSVLPAICRSIMPPKVPQPRGTANITFGMQTRNQGPDLASG